MIRHIMRHSSKIKKIRKDKNGFIASALVDFYSYVVFILILILFFALFNLRGCSNDPAVQGIASYSSGSVEGNQILLAYLRTPVYVDIDDDNSMEKITFAELISYSVDNPNLRGKLERETEEYLEDIKEILPDKGAAGWNMLIILMPDDDELLDVKTYDVILRSPILTIEQKLPVMKRNKYVLIKMSKERQGG